MDYGLYLMARTYLRMIHRVDLYKRVWTKDDYGQKIGSWALTDKEVPCYATPGQSSIIRMSPTIDPIDYFDFIFPYNTNIDYNTRLKMLISGIRKEVFYDKTLEVVRMERFPSYTGKVTHIGVNAKTVIESESDNK